MKRLWLVVGGLVLGTAACIFSVQTFTGGPSGILHRGIYYSSNPNYPCREWFADHYAEGVVPESSNFDPMKARNGDFKGYQYKSGTDSYVYRNDGVTPHPMGVKYALDAQVFGVDPESLYCHYADTTTVSVWLSTGKTTLTYAPGSRVEVYQGGHQNAGYRFLHSFAHSNWLVHQKFHTDLMAQRSTGGRLWDGLFLDNMGNKLYNYGDPIIRGGHVVEASGALIGSPAFNTWYWGQEKGYLAFLNASVDWLLAINVANSWTDDFVLSGVADRLVQEFVGNPVRDTWPPIGETVRRHQLAAANQVGLWTSAATGSYGTPPVPYDAASYGSLAYFLVVCDPEFKWSSHHNQDLTGPYRPDWPQRVLSRADSICVRLGKPTAPPSIWKAGNLPNGHHYEIWWRQYEHGLAYARILEPWNGRTDEVIKIQRPLQLLLVDVNGTLAKPDSIVILNGGGAILSLP